MKNNRVIILGDDHHNTLGVIRSFGEKGIRTDVVINYTKHSFVRYSRYIRSFHTIHSEEDVHSCIEQIIYSDTGLVILFCCSDWFISVIDKAYDRYKGRCVCFSAGNQCGGEINRLMSKNLQQAIALEAGLNIPKTWILSRNSSIPDDIVFPCIVKTDLSVEGTKADIVVCETKEALIKNISKNVNYIVQEYIEKEYELNVLGCAVDHGDNSIIPGVIHKIREYPVGKGSSSFSVLKDYTEYPHLNVDGIRKMMKLMKYDGLFSVEFVCKDHKCYFLEVNFRNDGNGYIPTSAGVNLPYIWACSVLKLSYDIPSVSLPHYFMADVRDIFHVKNGTLPFRIWFNDWKRTNCFLLYNKNDKKPFWGYCKTLFLSAIYKLIGKKY